MGFQYERLLYLSAVSTISFTLYIEEESKEKAHLQMGGHSFHGDPVGWSEEAEKYFLEILAERVKRDPNGAPIFKGTDWLEMDENMFLKLGLRYGPEKLRGKYHRMRSVHTRFAELINKTGVTWNSSTGTVFAEDSVWDAFFKRDKIFKTFKKKGCKIYPLLNLVFSNSTATGVFHNASNAVPQTSEEEHAIEQEYFGGVEGHGDNVGGYEVGGGQGSQSERKGKRNSDDLENDYIPGQRRAKKKNSASDKYDFFMQVWEQSLNAKKERDLARAERYKLQKGEATNLQCDEYSIDKCMDALNNLSEVTTTSFNKTLQFFTNSDWRRMFLLMNDERKKGWLADL
ncbi:hypothetical protein OROHE_010870 [Orobanche hederae]